MTQPTNSSPKRRPRKKAIETPPFYYDAEAAERAVRFFSTCLTHSKGELAGKPLTLSDWQADKIIRPMFGWKRADGSRRYRTVYVEIPRKAGKTTIAAGVALYLLTADAEPGAEVYSAAADRDQAGLAFEIAREMVTSSPALEKRIKPYKRALTVPSTASSYKVLSAEAYTKHGLNAHGIIFDEVHAQPNRELWDVLTTSTGARRQPLTFAITTAGFDRHSLCYELHDHAVKVNAGIVQDDSFLGVIFAADEGDDWKDPATWRKAHPGLGISVKEDYFAMECQKAQAMPSYENTFRRLLLNQWTEQDTRWLSMDVWDACAGEIPELEGATCYAGLDLSTTTDISALVLAFPIGGTVYLLPHFWVPGDNIAKRAKRDRVPYDVWVKQGFIEPTDGSVIDYDTIRRRFGELAERFHIKEVAIDRWNATQLATQLTGDGFEIVGFGQGFASMSAPTKELEKRLIGKEIAHGGNPVLRWMASNVAAEQDAAGNIKPSKAKSTERIDGIVAAIMALGRLSANENDQASAYDDGAFMFV